MRPMSTFFNIQLSNARNKRSENILTISNICSILLFLTLKRQKSPKRPANMRLTGLFEIFYLHVTCPVFLSEPKFFSFYLLEGFLLKFQIQNENAAHLLIRFFHRSEHNLFLQISRSSFLLSSLKSLCMYIFHPEIFPDSDIQSVQ